VPDSVSDVLPFCHLLFVHWFRMSHIAKRAARSLNWFQKTSNRCWCSCAGSPVATRLAQMWAGLTIDDPSVEQGCVQVLIAVCSRVGPGHQIATFTSSRTSCMFPSISHPILICFTIPGHHLKALDEAQLHIPRSPGKVSADLVCPRHLAVLLLRPSFQPHLHG
jgi:hypothetical protein